MDTIEEQSQDGLRDTALRREIKRMMEDKPLVKFTELRDWAVEMELEDSIHKRLGPWRLCPLPC